MAMSTATRTTPESAVRRRLLALLLAVMLAGGLESVYAAKGIPWDALSKSEQSVLRKHRGDWSRLDPAEQRRLRRGAQQYLELSPEKRKAVERKRSQYEKMSPEERKQRAEALKKSVEEEDITLWLYQQLSDANAIALEMLQEAT